MALSISIHLLRILSQKLERLLSRYVLLVLYLVIQPVVLMTYSSTKRSWRTAWPCCLGRLPRFAQFKNCFSTLQCGRFYHRVFRWLNVQFGPWKSGFKPKRYCFAAGQGSEQGCPWPPHDLASRYSFVVGNITGVKVEIPSRIVVEVTWCALWKRCNRKVHRFDLDQPRRGINRELAGISGIQWESAATTGPCKLSREARSRDRCGVPSEKACHLACLTYCRTKLTLSFQTCMIIIVEEYFFRITSGSLDWALACWRLWADSRVLSENCKDFRWSWHALTLSNCQSEQASAQSSLSWLHIALLSPLPWPCLPLLLVHQPLKTYELSVWKLSSPCTSIPDYCCCTLCTRSILFVLSVLIPMKGAELIFFVIQLSPPLFLSSFSFLWGLFASLSRLEISPFRYLSIYTLIFLHSRPFGWASYNGRFPVNPPASPLLWLYWQVFSIFYVFRFELQMVLFICVFWALGHGYMVVCFLQRILLRFFLFPFSFWTVGIR